MTGEFEPEKLISALEEVLRREEAEKKQPKKQSVQAPVLPPDTQNIDSLMPFNRDGKTYLLPASEVNALKKISAAYGRRGGHWEKGLFYSKGYVSPADYSVHIYGNHVIGVTMSGPFTPLEEMINFHRLIRLDLSKTMLDFAVSAPSSYVNLLQELKKRGVLVLGCDNLLERLGEGKDETAGKARIEAEKQAKPHILRNEVVDDEWKGYVLGGALIAGAFGLFLASWGIGKLFFDDNTPKPRQEIVRAVEKQEPSRAVPSSHGVSGTNETQEGLMARLGMEAGIEKGNKAATSKSVDLASHQNAVAHYNLGLALCKQHKLSDAVLAFKRAVELDPELSDAHYSLGWALMNVPNVPNSTDEAMSVYQRWVELEPKNAVAHHSLGYFLNCVGKPDEAVLSFKNAIELDPKCASTYYSLGLTLRKQGKLDDTVLAYKKVIELEPTYVVVRNQLGETLDAQGKLDEAILVYKKVIESDPKFIGAYRNLASTLKKQDKLDEAVLVHKKAIELEPTGIVLYSELGDTLHAQGKLDEAVLVYKKAIELDPLFLSLHQKLVLTLDKQGKLDEAVLVYKKVIALCPGNDDFVNYTVHYDLAVILKKQRKLDEARNHYQIAAQWGNKDAIKALEQMGASK